MSHDLATRFAIAGNPVEWFDIGQDEGPCLRDTIWQYFRNELRVYPFPSDTDYEGMQEGERSMPSLSLNARKGP